MNKEKYLGKIKSARFGYGGYQDAMLGFTFELGGDGWGVGDFKGTWAHHDKHCKWTKEDQASAFVKAQEFARRLIDDAKCKSLDKLVGKPVEVEFDGNSLHSWRILKEVI